VTGKRLTDLRELGGASVERPEDMTFPDGKAYPVMLPHEFGRVERVELADMLTRFQEAESDAYDENETRELFTEIVRRAYPSVPEKVISELNDEQLIYVSSDFLEISLLNAPDLSVTTGTLERVMKLAESRRAEMDRMANMTQNAQDNNSRTRSRSSKASTEQETP